MPCRCRDSGASAGSLCSRGAQRGRRLPDTGRCVCNLSAGRALGWSGRKPRRGAGRPPLLSPGWPLNEDHARAGWEAVRAGPARASSRSRPDAQGRRAGPGAGGGGVEVLSRSKEPQPALPADLPPPPPPRRLLRPTGFLTPAPAHPRFYSDPREKAGSGHTQPLAANPDPASHSPHTLRTPMCSPGFAPGCELSSG